MTALIQPSSNPLLAQALLRENQIIDLINAIDKDSDCRWSKYADALNHLTFSVYLLAKRQIKELTPVVDHMKVRLLKEARFKLLDKSRSNLIQRISQFSETILKTHTSDILLERIKIEGDRRSYLTEIDDLVNKKLTAQAQKELDNSRNDLLKLKETIDRPYRESKENKYSKKASSLSAYSSSSYSSSFSSFSSSSCSSSSNLSVDLVYHYLIHHHLVHLRLVHLRLVHLRLVYHHLVCHHLVHHHLVYHYLIHYHLVHLRLVYHHLGYHHLGCHHLGCHHLVLLSSSSSLDRFSYTTLALPDMPRMYGTVPIRAISSEGLEVAPSLFILERAKKLEGLIDKHPIEETLIQLQGFQEKIYFEFSHMEMTICQRVYFHNAPQSTFTASNLKQAMLRTCQELAIAGFTESLKEQNQEAAEKMYAELFKAVHIWNEYQDELDSIGYDEGLIKNEKEKREHEIHLSFTALTNIVLRTFRDDWKYSTAKRWP